LQLLPAADASPQARTISGRSLTAEELEATLAGLAAQPLARRWVPPGEFRISLAGAQEKTAFLRHQGEWMEPLGATPTTHIFKLPIGRTPQGIDLFTSVENEWLCHRVLRALAVPVADCSILPLTNFKVLVVERFDRRPARDGSWIVRLPQEDLCQATATPAALKYESDGGPGIQQLMELLWGADEPDLARRDFFRTQVVFWLLGALDGHAKNFSIFLEPGGRFRLTPRYDVLSAWPALGSGGLARQSIKMAMAVSGTNRHYRWTRIHRRHWIETAVKVGFGARVDELLDELVESVPGALEQVAATLPVDFPASIAEPILAGVAASARRLADG